METVFAVVLIILVLLFYLSNPRNKVNKWCAIAGFIFWLGVAKEAVLYNIINSLPNADSLQTGFMPVYSVCTWALYSLAMPTAVIFALYFCDFEKTHIKHLRLLKVALYLPALILSFFFPPLDFRTYQVSSLPFWTAYAVYNLLAGIVFTILMIKGVRIEKPGKSKIQKKRVRIVVLPPVVFWVTSVFFTHPLGLTKLFKLWQANAFILLVGVVTIIIMMFRDGFMGLKMSGETYSWNTDMNLINTGADYTSHMIKNQTSKMELCIEHLNSHFSEAGEEPPEELAILSRSINTLQNYVDKIKRHSQNVHLLEEPCKLAELLADAMPLSLTGYNGITMNIDIPENVFWVCDKSHMTEVFSNIITNAVEAIRGSGTIGISGSYGKSYYLLHITDTGVGMNNDDLRIIFTPYYTTKSTEKNFGLGLAYCKNVVTKHNGNITAKSKQGKGTTVTIAFPLRRVAASGNETEDHDV